MSGSAAPSTGTLAVHILIFVGWWRRREGATLRGMGSVNQIIGGHGECLAARYAVAQGMTVLERNWRCPTGELDMVLREGGELVFCEVKARSGVDFGQPVEAVVPAKK